MRSRIGYRTAGEELQGTVFGFIEPEVGWWTRDNRGLDAKDTLLGVNVGGAVRLRVFEYFIAGGVGYHMLESDVRNGPQISNVSDDNIGVNAQFGFDVRMSETLSIFGVGRLDLVQIDDDSFTSPPPRPTQHHHHDDHTLSTTGRPRSTRPAPAP